MEWDDAWAEIERRWLPEDTERPNEDYKNQYQQKFRVAEIAQAKVIAEIGVRAGYSGLAMLLASPGARYIGFEQDRGAFGGVQGITATAAPRVFAGFEHEIRYVDSQSISRIDDRIDLFHIDGDHSYDGAMHDLELAWACSQYVLVDDYDFIRPVQAAVDHFIVTHRMAFPYVQALSDGGFRGSMLIIGARNEKLAARKSGHFLP